MSVTIVVDKRDPAYTVFLRIPAEKLETLLAELEGVPGVQLLDWRDLVADPQRHVAAHVVKNDYAGQNVVAGLLELIENYAGAPVGLTWNGGIAFTYTDYQHARRTLERYTADPAEYERRRGDDPAGDPVDPAVHFDALLGDEA